MSIKIAIADDHSLITEGVSNMLRHNSEIELIATYINGAGLLKGIEKIEPDVLLLDFSMPDMQGDELTDIISKRYPRIRILILTSADNIFHIRNMLEYPIAGYLLKHLNREVLTRAIKTAYEGGTYFDETVARMIEEDRRKRRRQAETGTMLTRREQEILQLLANNHTNKEIATLLHISARTVEHHRKSILEKLEVKQTSALVRKALEWGIIIR